MPNTFDFSFSGVKTTVINYLHKLNQKGEEINKANSIVILTHENPDGDAVRK